MWSKSFRLCMFYAVYQELFTSDIPGQNLVFDWDFAFSVLDTQDDLPDIEGLNSSLGKLKLKRPQFEALLQKYLQNWGRTYDIIRAILLVFLEELVETSGNQSSPEEIASILSKYIRLTQDYVGGENTSLVHAVASNITEKEMSTVWELK